MRSFIVLLLICICNLASAQVGKYQKLTVTGSAKIVNRTVVGVSANLNSTDSTRDDRIPTTKAVFDAIKVFGGGGSSAAGSDQYVQVKVGSSFGAFGGFLFDYNNNRLKAPKLRLGLDHWSNERVTFTNYQEYTYGANQTNLYDSTYNTHDEKITTIGDNLILQNFKSTQVIVGYHKLGNTSTFPTDYQHNTFTQVLGGGFLNNAANGAQVVNLGSTAPNATTVSNHKFLIQGGGLRTITGWSSNLKQVTEVSSAGTAQNHADLNIGFLYRSGSASGTGFVFTNRYGMYINPIKDAGVTNAYGIYQEGASDLNYFGGNIYSKRYAQFGPTHWMTNARVVAFVDDTLSGTNPSPNRAIMADRTITLLDNTTLGGSSGNAILATGYYKPDANTTLTSDYQANVFGIYSAGGFLNKSGVATQNITSGNSAINAPVVSMSKLLYQNADTKVLTGFIGNYKSAWQIASGGSTENYSDFILGIKVRSGSGTGHTVTNHRGLHIIPLKDAATTNAYSIFQEGTTDTNYFAGIVRQPNIAFKSLDTTNYKLSVVDAAGVSYRMYWPTFGGAGGATDLTHTVTSTNVTVLSSTGADAILPPATTTDAGITTAAMKRAIDSAFTKTAWINDSVKVTYNSKGEIVERDTSKAFVFTNGLEFISPNIAGMKGVTATPSANKYWGTNASSIFGMYDFPSVGISIGTPITSATASAILFAGTGGQLQQKVTDLYYDSANRYLNLFNSTGATGIKLRSTSGGGYQDVVFDNGFNGNNVTIRGMGNLDNGKLYFVTTGTNRMALDQSGNFGIGTTSPSANLHVVGTARLVTGNQGAGKILVSDANGNADWQTNTSALPSQTGNAGKTLQTNGTTASWGYSLYPWDYAARDSVSTSNAVATTAHTVAIDANARGIIEVRVEAISSDGAKGLVGIKRVKYRKIAGTLTLSTVEVEMSTDRDVLTTADFTIVGSGNNIVIQVTGESAQALDWKVTVFATNKTIFP